jgi:WD40 repeat protein
MIKEDETVQALQLLDCAGIDVTRLAIWPERESLLGGLVSPNLAEWIMNGPLVSSQAVDPQEGCLVTPQAPTPVPLTRPLVAWGELQSYRIDAMTFGPEPSWVTTGSCSENVVDDCLQSVIEVWDPAEGRRVAGWQAQAGRIYSLTWSAHGAMIADSACTRRDRVCMESEVVIWEGLSVKVLTTLSRLPGYVFRVSFSADGKLLGFANRAYGSEAGEYGEITVLDPETGKVLATRDANEEPVIAVFSPAAGMLALGEGTGVLLWEPGSGVEQHLSVEVEPSELVDWSPDGAEVAVWVCPHPEELAPCTDAEILRLDAATGAVRGRLVSPATRVFFFTEYMSGGRERVTLACLTVQDGQCTDERLQLWEVATGKVVGELPVEVGAFRGLTASPDGERIMLLHSDQSFCLLEVDALRTGAN